LNIGDNGYFILNKTRWLFVAR